MTPERWQQVKVLFTGASELPSAERRAYLEGACGGDVTLLAEVESLLAAHAKEEAIVDRPAIAHVADAGSTEGADAWLGRRIGSYEIVALIGRGGMGDVYRARRVDAQYEKEVAVKLVPGGWHASFVLQRFRAERQILADLEHPHIARLVDGGATEDGSPYLVMELVEGEPLDRYAESRHLSLRERLRLFRDVCAAVAYAHQHLVVHRDLKPGNILVTAEGDVKLLDFGIAKLLQPATAAAGPEPTGTLMQVLTPGYASPEQILGKPITTASDVYSLGVVLYVLLTGRSPYRGKLDSAGDAIREICDTEPPRPSAAAPQRGGEPLGRDLDAIVLRALRKEPERRYASVEGLSEDIRRYLEGLPVVARGDGFGYRAGKFVRRHRASVAATAIALLAVLAAASVAFWQARDARRERAVAERERDRNAGLVDYMLGELSDQIAPSHRLEVITSMGGQVLASLDAIPPAERTPANALQRARVLVRLGRAAELAGHSDVAEKRLAAAIALFDRLAGPEPAGRRAARERAEVRTELARITEDRGDRQRAQEMVRVAVAELRDLVARDPGDAAHRAALAGAVHQTGRIQLNSGAVSEALANLREATRMFEALPPELLSQREPAIGLLNAHCYAGRALEFGGDLEGAAAEFRRAVAQAAAFAAAHPTDLQARRELSVVTGDLARILRKAGRLGEAVEVASNALAISLDLAERDPRNLFYRYDVGFGYARRGRFRLLLGDLAGALEDYGADVAIGEELSRLEPHNGAWRASLADSLTNQGKATMELDRLPAALAIHQRALAMRAELLRAAPEDQVVRADVAESHLELGRVRARMKTPEMAEREWRQAVELLERALATTDLPYYRSRYARALLELGERERARPVVARLVAEGTREPELLELARRHGLGG